MDSSVGEHQVVSSQLPLVTGEIGHLTAGLTDQQDSRGNVPGLNFGGEVSFSLTCRHPGCFQAGGAELANIDDLRVDLI